MKKVSIIGSGNVATHLAKVMFSYGYIIHEVYSKTKENAEKLAKKVNAQVIYQIADLDVINIDLIIISVNDDQIHSVSNSIPRSNSVIVHTSGTKNIDELSKHQKRGVFYPLQTFSKEVDISFENIPICLEADSENTFSILNEIANTISKNVRVTNSENRKEIHLAAVFACNFTNHMLALASNILEEGNQDLSILEPLIKETIKKSFLSSPKLVQTGPAIREDMEVINKQIKRLEGTPIVQKLYQDISNSIIKLKNE